MAQQVAKELEILIKRQLMCLPGEPLWGSGWRGLGGGGMYGHSAGRV